MAKKIICIGDSITEGISDEQAMGWPGRLAQKISTHYPEEDWIINNLGIAGNTLSDIYTRLHTEVAIRQPSTLIFSAGVNDTILRLWPDTTEPKISFTYRKEIWENISTFFKKLECPVFVTTLLPVDENKLPLVYMPYDKEDNGIQALNKSIDQWNEYLLKHQKNNPHYSLINLHTDCHDIIPHLSDGLHPNQQGYQIITDIIFEALRSRNATENTC